MCNHNIVKKQTRFCECLQEQQKLLTINLATSFYLIRESTENKFVIRRVATTQKITHTRDTQSLHVCKKKTHTGDTESLDQWG